MVETVLEEGVIVMGKEVRVRGSGFCVCGREGDVTDQCGDGWALFGG
jgi:hypothetical protein